MDTSVKPGDDFYVYANGNWLKNNPVPPEYSRWGSFNELVEKNNDALHEIAEKAKTSPPSENRPAPEVQKVGDYYASGMNEAEIRCGRKPLQDEMQGIDNLKERNDLIERDRPPPWHRRQCPLQFRLRIRTIRTAQWRSRTHSKAGSACPIAITTPRRTTTSKRLRDELSRTCHQNVRLARRIERAKAGEDAKKIMAIETKLAKPARTRVELRDPQKNYNKMTQAELQKLMPDFKWDDYFKEIQRRRARRHQVGQPDFFKAAKRFSRLFRSTIGRRICAGI